MDADVVVASISDAYQAEPDNWSTVAERALNEWSSEPQVAAMITYLQGLSDSERDDLLRSPSQLDALRGWLVDGSFDPSPADSAWDAMSDLASEPPVEPIADAVPYGTDAYLDAPYAADSGGVGQPDGPPPDPAMLTAQPRIDGGDDDTSAGLDEVFTFEQLIKLLDLGILEAVELADWSTAQ